MPQLDQGDVDYLIEVLEMCQDFMERSCVEDLILNKINMAIVVLERE